MNARFHTPSLGDEVIFDLNDSDDIVNAASEETSSEETSTPLLLPSDVDNLNPRTSFVNLRQDTEAQRMDYQGSNGELMSGNIPMATIPAAGPTTMAARKQMVMPEGQEAVKPISPYGYFFRDTVSAIKQQNQNCSYPEIMRIVASMWEALDPVSKNTYIKKHEMTRNEFIRQQNQQHQQQQQSTGIPPSEQMSQLELNSTSHLTPLQTKPAVFTIPRFNNDTAPIVNNNMVCSNYSNSLQVQAKQDMGMYMPHQQQQGKQSPLMHLMYDNNTSQMSGKQQFRNDSITLNRIEINNEKNSNDNSIMMGGSYENLSDKTQTQYQIVDKIDPTATMRVDSNVTIADNMAQINQQQPQLCMRNGCKNIATVNPDWEDEYCSNECVVIHCRNVFNSWVQSNIEASEADSAGKS